MPEVTQPRGPNPQHSSTTHPPAPNMRTIMDPMNEQKDK